MFCATLLVCLLGAMPVPGKDAQLEAQRLLAEVFGEDIKAAETPEAKRALAREILGIARQDPDAANKYVCLQTAKRLAAEAEDGALALAVVQELVAAFDSELGGDGTAILRQADALWDAAEKKKGAEQLAGRLDAAEMWLRAKSKSAILKHKWQLRLDEINAVEPKVRLELPLATVRLLRGLDGSTVMVINRKSNLALNVARDSRHPGATIIQWGEPLRNKNSQWLVEVLDNHCCRFRNKSTGLWLASKEVSAPDFSRTATQLPSNAPGTKWELRPLGNDYFAILYPGTNLCLGPWNAHTGRGYGVHLYPFQPGAAHLQWRLAPVPP